MASNVPPVSDDTAAPVETSRAWWQSPLQLPKKAVSWLGSHKMTGGLVIGGGVAMVLPILIFWGISSTRAKQQSGNIVKVEQITDALQRKAYSEAKAFAKRLLAQKRTPVKESGVAQFALGLATAQEAEKAVGKDRRSLSLLASRYFQEALLSGFPAEFAAEGFYYFGKSLFENGQFMECREVLLEAVNKDDPHTSEIHALLADAYRSGEKPDLVKAMEQNTLFLNEKKGAREDRRQGLLQRARILLQMGKNEECFTLLKEIPQGSDAYPAAMVIAGRSLMQSAQSILKANPEVTDQARREAKAKYDEAVKRFRLAETAAEGAEATRQAMYLIGVCFLEQGDLTAANAQFVRTHRNFSDSPEGAAASFQQAELSRHAGRDPEMLSEYRRAVAGMGDSETFYNPWISIDLLRNRLTEAYQEFLGKRQFDVCRQLIGLMKPLFPVETVRRMQAEMSLTWAQYLAGKVEKSPASQRESLQRKARDQYRRAGQYYAAMAQAMLGSREYSNRIWDSATAYLHGHAFREAANQFREYLKNEVERRNPQALNYLGEALLSLGDYEAALESLRECIEHYPRDVSACDARLHAAQVYREKGKFSEAEKLLFDNLNGDYLTPASKEWRESLFLLATMLHEEGRYAEAVQKFEEAVKRYPDLPEAIHNRYLLADSHRHLANALIDELKKDVSGSSREMQSKPIRESLRKAQEQYETILERLGRYHDPAELTAEEKAILRNSYFALGDVLYAGGDYQAAIRAYFSGVNRYQNHPESLDAYVQIANAYRHLKKPQEAHNALEQAKLALERMKTDVSFEETSIYSRKQWSERLDRLQQFEGKGA